jgi:hypothetical protein
VSQSTFEDEYFREMLQAYYEAAGGEKVGTAPFLTVEALKRYIAAEFQCFLIFAKYIGDEMIKWTKGNPFAQSLHDCATLRNRTKCCAIGACFMDFKVMEPHVICLSMLPVEDGTGEVLQKAIEDSTHRAFQRPSREVYNQTISDRAALRVAKLQEHDPDACG